MTILNIKTFSTNTCSPHIVLLGAIHGNEQCGTHAINKLIENILAKKIILKTGKITCIPICNPLAYKQNKRFIDNDLNRNFETNTLKNTYEETLRKQLRPIIQSADILLDLHSYNSFGNEFCFLGTSNKHEIDFCLNLGVNDFIYGWSEAFKHNQFSIGTVEFARLHGAIATTLECGHHHNPQNSQIAYQAILNALAYCNIITQPPPKPTDHNFYKMQQVFYKQNEGSLTKTWNNLDFVHKDQIIAKMDNSSSIIAPKDGYVILPKNYAEIKKEWFYFATKERFQVPIA